MNKTTQEMSEQEKGTNANINKELKMNQLASQTATSKEVNQRLNPREDESLLLTAISRFLIDDLFEKDELGFLLSPAHFLHIIKKKCELINDEFIFTGLNLISESPALTKKLHLHILHRHEGLHIKEELTTNKIDMIELLSEKTDSNTMDIENNYKKFMSSEPVLRHCELEDLLAYRRIRRFIPIVSKPSRSYRGCKGNYLVAEKVCLVVQLTA